MKQTEQQQDARLAEIVALGQQRYLDAGGDPRSCTSGMHGDDYLTNEERQEALMLMQKLASIYIKNGYAYCQGRSWKLANNRVNCEDNKSI